MCVSVCLEEKGTFITLRRHKTYTTNKHPSMIAGAKRRKIRKTAARRNEATAYHHRCSRSLRVVNDIYIDKGKKMNNNNNKITNNKQQQEVGNNFFFSLEEIKTNYPELVK